MIARSPRVEDIVGREFEGALARELQAMLLDACVKSGVALGPRAVEVLVNFPLQIAAAHILCASGFLYEVPREVIREGVHSHYKITPAGIERAKHIVSARSTRHQ